MLKVDLGLVGSETKVEATRTLTFGKYFQRPPAKSPNSKKQAGNG
jgi:hypothetical protein